jgi:hypothetical protein
MSRIKLTLAIAIVLLTLGLIAAVSGTNTETELLQLNLQTKQQEIEIIRSEKDALEQERIKAEGNAKRLKEIEQENKELQKALEDAQARKAEKMRIAQQEAQNAVQAAPVQSSDVSSNCSSWMTAAGITHPLARDLIQRESGCDPTATNPSSGACGIPQALPCSKMGDGHFDSNKNWVRHNDPIVQLKWMQNYVIGRYGSWEAAIAFHDANNWY